MAIDNKDKKVLKSSIEREQNEVACSAECEKIKGSKNLNVPHMRFPEFTEEWVNVSLKDVADFQKERISSGLLDESTYISTENILQNFQGVQSAISIPANTNVVAYKKNDILLSNIRPYLKKVWFSDKIGGCSADVFVLRSKTCEPEFLYNVIASDKFINYVMSGAKGVKMPRGDKNQMESFSFSIPAVAEQRKISRLFQLLDERIATQNKIIEKLQSLIKGIVDELMTVLLKGKLYPFSSFYIKAGEGGTPTTSVNEYYLGGTIPFIKIEDLSCKYLTSNKDFITELGMQKSSAWLIPSHSVIYSNGATIGAISINEYPICTKQGILGIVPNTNINVEYLYLLMSSSYFSKEVNRIVTEGTMKTAYLKDINHIKCPLPSMAQQQNITNLTSSIEKKLFVEQELLKLLNIQKQHILRTMFI